MSSSRPPLRSGASKDTKRNSRQAAFARGNTEEITGPVGTRFTRQTSETSTGRVKRNASKAKQQLPATSSLNKKLNSVGDDMLHPRAPNKNVLRDHPEGEEGSEVDFYSDSLSSGSLSEQPQARNENKQNGGKQAGFQIPQVRRKNTLTSLSNNKGKQASATHAPSSHGNRKRDVKAAGKPISK